MRDRRCLLEDVLVLLAGIELANLSCIGLFKEKRVGTGSGLAVLAGNLDPRK
jgi:hypothetical protein